MERLVQDLRFGLKILLKDRAFTAAVLITLALCIGANTAMFSIVDSVLLRPLPIPDADQVLRVFNSYPKAGAARAGNGVPDYYDRLREVDAFQNLALWNGAGWTLGDGRSGPQRIQGMAVTPSLFQLLRTQPLRGRLFDASEGEIGQHQKVILSYGLWQELFGGREEALSSEIRLSGTPYAVIGVLPEDFLFLEPEVRLWTPLAFTDEEKSDERRHSNSWGMVGRLRPGATLELAQAQIDALNARNLERFPHFREALLNVGFHTIVVPLAADTVREVRGTLYLLWAGVLFVLLIGCVNIANLCLVRASGRGRELSIRSALGAGQHRMVRQLITEGLLLAGAGGLLGLFLGAGALKALALLGLDQLPRATEIALHPRTVALTLLISAFIGLVLGWIPALQLRRGRAFGALREEGRSGTTSRATQRLRQGLVVAQVAFAFLLLIGAGLLLASFRRVLAVDPGFRPDGVWTATYSLPESRYGEEADLLQFEERLLPRLSSLPGVNRAAAVSHIPFGSDFNDSVILAEGYTMAPGESVVSPTRQSVTPGYFEALGIPLIGGRLFDPRDTAQSQKVVVIDERLARQFWSGQDAVGQRLYLPGDGEDLLALPPLEDRLTVIGVVAEIKMKSRVQQDEAVGAYYFPTTQAPSPRMVLVLRSAGQAEALASQVRQELAELDPELALYGIRSMNERLEADLLSRRSPMMLALIFAALALLLAAVGLYGTLAYVVSQRQRELGIRMALGGTAARIGRMVLKEGLVLLALGLALGIAGTFALGQALQSQLYGIQALNVAVMVQVALILSAVALAASLLPALRASRTDPVVALEMP